MQTMKKIIAGATLASLSLSLSLSTASAFSTSQSRAERAELAAERRAMAEQRLAMLSSDRAERLARQTEVLTRMSEVTPEMVEERLVQAELAMLEALVLADAELIAARVNEAGAQATEFLTTQQFENLTEEQFDTLVAAAARAASLTPGEVELLLRYGSFYLSGVFDNLDADEIASTFNEIGEEALALRP